jgi:hypothetical protein
MSNQLVLYLLHFEDEDGSIVEGLPFAVFGEGIFGNAKHPEYFDIWVGKRQPCDAF